MKKAIKLFSAAIGLALCVMTYAEAASSITYTVGKWQVTMTDLGVLPTGTKGNTSSAGTISGINSHVYSRTGSFEAKLTVTDGKGAIGSSNTISV